MESDASHELKWRSCPAKAYPKKALFGWCAILFCAFLIVTTNIILGICLTAVLIATQANFFFSSTFTVSEDGIIAKYPLRTKRFSWEQVKRAQFFKDACFMFTRKKPSALDGWSGMAIYYFDNRDDVVPTLKEHLVEGVAS